MEPVTPLATISSKITPTFDATSVENNGTINITPIFKVIPNKQVASNDEARIEIEINQAIGPSDVIAVALEPDQDFSTGIIDLILINRLGFDGIEKLDKEINSMTVRLFTKPDAPDSHISVSDLAVITNPSG